MTTGDERQGAEAPRGGLEAVLLEVARNLKSPPLLFGFGVIVAVVVFAIVAGESLGDFQTLIVAFGLAAIVAWVVVEFVRARARVRGRVDVRARRVGRTGVVGGVEGLPADRAAPDVTVRGKDVEGTVKGVVFGPPDGDRRGRSE